MGINQNVDNRRHQMFEKLASHDFFGRLVYNGWKRGSCEGAGFDQSFRHAGLCGSKTDSIWTIGECERTQQGADHTGPLPSVILAVMSQ